MGNLDFTAFEKKLGDWDVEGFLAMYPRMSLVPSAKGNCQFVGWIDFAFVDDDGHRVEESFEVVIDIPESFPRDLPLVSPIGTRIPKDFHRLACGALCLGSPTRQLLLVKRSPTITGFILSCVLPYLYGFRLFESTGKLPFGELAHGRRGLLDDIRDLYKVASDEVAIELVRLTSRPRRSANKQPCPCGSGQPLARCHNRALSRLRKALGRRWFRAQYDLLKKGGKQFSNGSNVGSLHYLDDLLQAKD